MTEEPKVQQEQAPIDKKPELIMSKPQAVDPNVKVDRYGQIIDGEVKEKTKAELKLEEEENVVERRHEQKWLHMLAHWDEFSGKRRNKLRERIKKGIPDALRSKAWPKLIIPHYGTPDYHPTDVDKLLEGGNQVGYQTIEKDLARTMPNYPMFNNEKVFNSLRRVLYAYSNKDPELGYTQGMSAIAGLLLLYLDESTAYDCFETLMLDKRYGLRNYFIADFPRLKLLNKVWEEAMKDRYPKIWNTFSKVNLDSLYYTPSWFLTLFFNQDFPPLIKFRIFDRFCEFSSKALISFGLVVVSRHKDVLINKPFEQVIMTMQHPCKSGNMDDWRYVLKKYDELWISDAKYKNYFHKAGVEYFD